MLGFWCDYLDLLLRKSLSAWARLSRDVYSITPDLKILEAKEMISIADVEIISMPVAASSGLRLPKTFRIIRASGAENGK
jgi:hypothetical protein